MNTVLQDGLRGCLQDLDVAIRHCRTCIGRNDSRKARYLAKYLRLIRKAHALQEAIQAKSKTMLTLCAPRLPMPINPGFVGLSPPEKFRREWQLDATTPAALRQAA